MRDHAYDEIPYRAPEMPHRYGPSVHVVAEPLALTQLARLCAKGTIIIVHIGIVHIGGRCWAGALAGEGARDTRPGLNQLSEYGPSRIENAV